MTLHTGAGLNERLDGLQAAVVRLKLTHLDRWNHERRRLAALYCAHLKGVEPLEDSTESPCKYHLFPIRVAARDDLAAHLAARGIATGVHYP